MASSARGKRPANWSRPSPCSCSTPAEVSVARSRTKAGVLSTRETNGNFPSFDGDTTKSIRAGGASVNSFVTSASLKSARHKRVRRRLYRYDAVFLVGERRRFSRSFRGRRRDRKLEAASRTTSRTAPREIDYFSRDRKESKRSHSVFLRWRVPLRHGSSIVTRLEETSSTFSSVFFFVFFFASRKVIELLGRRRREKKGTEKIMCAHLLRDDRRRRC